MLLSADQIDRLIDLLTSWDRDALESRFLAYRSSFPVDLTPDFLRRLSVDQIRHLFMAVCLQNRRLPAECEPATAQAA